MTNQEQMQPVACTTSLTEAVRSVFFLAEEEDVQTMAAAIASHLLAKPYCWEAVTGTAGAGDDCNKFFFMEKLAKEHVQKHGGYYKPLYAAPVPSSTNQEQRPDGIAEPLSGAVVGSNNEPPTLKGLQDLKIAFSEQNHRLYVATERATTLEAENKRLREALKTPFCVLYLDGRNEHGSHVLASYPRSFNVEDADVEEQAEAILQAAENAGFQVGQHVWAEFTWVKPQIGDEGRVELAGYWDFHRINDAMTRAALKGDA